jgi:hypothetical protein
LSTKIQHTEAHLVSDRRLADKIMVWRRLPPTRTMNVGICCTICFEHAADVLWILHSREEAEMSKRFMNKVPIESSVESPTARLARGIKHAACHNGYLNDVGCSSNNKEIQLAVL